MEGGVDMMHTAKKKDLKKYMFLLPSLLGVTIFVFGPFADLIRRSFCTAVTEQFCGIANYQTIFTNQAFLLAVQNTIRFTLVCIPLLILISFFISVLLSNCKLMQMLKSMYLFPLAVPTATVVLVWKMLFYKEGMLNQFLELFGVAPTDWMNTGAAFWGLVISYIWKNLGYTIVLWLAGIGSISKEVLEAAKVDGAGEWNSLRYVIIPNLKPSLYTITILSLLNSFKVFREAYLVAGSYPQEKIYLLQHIFNNWFMNLDLDKMAAASVCVAIVFFAIVAIFQKLWSSQN